MITLLSIRLRNFRKVKEGTFSLLEDGITGLSGANGAGKSSFLAATVWALYGVRPDDVPISGLRRQGSSVKEECSVSVLFRHAGQVIEVIRELRGKGNKSIINIFVDGKEQTVTSVGAAEKWLVDRLKIDADAFTTAFVVRQKELDALVDARPAERRATIERLSGIEKMSVALKTARAEENEAKKLAQSLSGSEDDVSQAEMLVMEHEARVLDAQEIVEDLQTAASSAQAKADEASSAYEEALQDFNIYAAALSELEIKKSHRQNAITLLDRSKSELSAYASLPDIDVSSDDLAAKGREQAEELRLLKAQIEAARDERYRHASQVSMLEENVHHAETEVRDLEDKVSKSETDPKEESRLVKEKKKQDSKVSTSVDSVSHVESQIDSLQRQRSILTRSLNTLETHLEGAECPTCHTHLEDPAVLISDLRSQVAELEEQEGVLGAELNRARANLSKARDAAGVAEAALNAFTQRKEAHKTAQETLVRAQERLSSLREELGALQADKPAEGHVDALNEQLAALEGEIDRTRTEYVSVREAERSKQRREHLLAEVERQEAEIAKLSRTVEDHMSFIATLVEVTPEDLDKYRQERETATNDAQKAAQELTNAEYALGIASERLQNVRQSLTAAKSLYDRKQAALALAAQKAAVSDVLDEFRKDRIASIAPELSETATSLISAMTNGYYTEVVLDENFTPSVVDSEGNERPVAWLSGGEESVVALALRIAIGDLMTGGEGGLLWLDEVLTAQDAGRRSSLLNTLRNLTGRQIVMINHTPDANDMVDKIVTVVSTDDGSVIEESTVLSDMVSD